MASNRATVVRCVHVFSPGLIQLLASVPANCSTAFWDPIEGQCICTSSTCQFQDTSRPIGVSHLSPSMYFFCFSFLCSLTERTSLAAGLGVWLPPRQPQQALMYRLMEMARRRPYQLVFGWQSCLGSLVPCWAGRRSNFLPLGIVDHFWQQSRGVTYIWTLLILHGLAWIFIFA
jgi:hypothetical protein